ncbi:MAG: hypothetical protein LC540_15575 [Candidatus Thiodiazotropha sp.]|nr:hypothetical protein [Candidatus Thiodiazotropha sp.]
MSNIIPFKPRHERDCERNLQDFVARARDELTLFEEQGGFDTKSWKMIYANGKPVSMSFTELGAEARHEGAPMREPFASFAKAYVRERQSLKAVNPANMMAVLKHVYVGLLAIHETPDILKFDGPALRVAVESIQGRIGSSLRYRVGNELVTFLKWLKDSKICLTTPSWANPCKRPGSRAQGTSREDREWQKERLLTQDEILVIGEAFRLAETKEHIYYTAVSALLLNAPSRASEVSSLTVECIDEESGLKEIKNEETGKVEIKEVDLPFLNWDAAKGGGFMPKTIHPDMEGTIREAVRRITELSQPARDAAAWAIEHPDRFYRHAGCITAPGHGEDQALNYAEFCAAMGVKVAGVWKSNLFDPADWSAQLDTKWFRVLRQGKTQITYRDLARFTVEKYKKAFPKWPYMGKRKDRLVSEQLCLLRENEFHVDFQPKAYSWVSPSVNDLNHRLAGRPKMKVPKPSMFTELGLHLPDSSPLEITSHQLRVWGSTQAERGDMDAITLALFAGRVRIDDNEAYDLRTPDEMEAQSRALMGIQRAQTGGELAIAAIQINKPVTFAMLGDPDRHGTAQLTGYGICEHDYSMTPCEKHGDCMACTEHACIKGLPKQLERLRALDKTTENEFRRAMDATEFGEYGADKWVTYYAKRLAVIRTVIRMYQDDNVPDGTVVRIPEELVPSNTQVALLEQGLKTEIVSDEPVSQNMIDRAQNEMLAIFGGVNEAQAS